MENPLDGPWPSAAVSGRCVGRTDTVELRCLGQRKCFGPTLERDPQRRLGNSARWPEQPRGNRRLGAPRRVSAKEHADEQGAAGTRLQREDRCLIEAPVAQQADEPSAVHGLIRPPRCALPEQLTCINGAGDRCTLTFEVCPRKRNILQSLARISLAGTAKRSDWRG